MRNGSREEGFEWMEAGGFPIFSGRPRFSVYESDRIPTDAGKRINMVKEDLSDFRGHEVLVYFAEWSVWPSGE